MKKFLSTALIVFFFINFNSFANELIPESKVTLNEVEIFGTKINKDKEKKILAWY